MFQQHQGESLYEAWTRFKDLLQKVPHHGIDLWLLIQIFYDHVDYTTQMGIDYAASGRLIKLRPDEAWATIEELAQYEDEGWNDAVIPGEESLNYENPDIEQLLGIMERKVDTLMKDVIRLMGRSEGEERVEQLEECMKVIIGDFMQLSLEVTRRLKDKIREEFREETRDEIKEEKEDCPKHFDTFPTMK
ncbi:hypothetical protein Tco_0847309 [Tanacetum coccineum]